MEKRRLEQIENVAKKIISNSILENLDEKDRKAFRLVNVIWVKLANDMSYLDVFVSSFENKEGLCKALAVYANDIERVVFREMSLRKKPRIRFRYDDSWAVSSDILEKINAL